MKAKNPTPAKNENNANCAVVIAVENSQLSRGLSSWLEELGILSKGREQSITNAMTPLHNPTEIIDHK